MSRIRVVRRALYGVVGAFALAACGMAWLVDVQQKTIYNAERYDSAFYAVTAKAEAAALGTAAGIVLARPGDAKAVREVGRRYDVLRSRMEGMRQGAFGRTATEDASSRSFVESLEKATKDLLPYVRAVSEPGSARSVMEGVTAMQRALMLVGASVGERFAAENAADLLMLRRCTAMFSALLAGLLLSGVSLIVLLVGAGRRIEILATTDYLTGLVNRRKLVSELSEAIADGTGGTAIVSLDLDRFKDVNDTLGHPVGDAMLTTVARRIRGAAGSEAVVARLGGDEFCILVRDAGDRTAVEETASRIAAGVCEAMDIDGHRLVVRTSIGIAFSADGCEGAADLLKRADVALYRSKSEGGIRVFENGMDAHLVRRRLLERDLRSAFEDERFELHFQPVVDLDDPRRIVCREALVRWRHPVKGMVPPSEFIPVAEEIGLIVPMGAWIMREACRQASTWTGSERVAVNVSAIQFRRDDVPALVASALAASGLPASRLEIEITESVLVDDVERMKRTIRILADMGVRVAMDDFGTGYSSLAYVAEFDFHKLKIDRSFVAGLDVGRNRDVVQLIVALAAARRMTVTAEGVETKEQADALRAMGCGEAQGYLFGRPAIMASSVSTVMAAAA